MLVSNNMSAIIIASKELSSLLEFWIKQKGSRLLPHRSDFDFYECCRWLGHLAIVRVMEGPKQYKITLHGTAASQYYGKDFTGKFLEDMFKRDESAPLLEAYKQAHKTLHPVYMITEPFTILNKAKRMERLVLPLGTGDHVEHLLAGIYPAE